MSESSLQEPTIGRSFPLGATVIGGGVNFAVYSKTAASVELLLFNRCDDPRPQRVIPLQPQYPNRTFHYWHIFVPGLQAGQIYGYRARGSLAPESGLRFDYGKVLLDPYSKSVVVPSGYDREAACLPGDHIANAMKSVVVPEEGYDWEGDAPLARSFANTVIYEMHAAGFTRHPNSGLPEELRGTFRGLVEKIPYLVELGVTAVELSPVFQFDPQEAPSGLTNYWGYNPVSFFAPHTPYAASKDPLGAINEFRDMVKALHRAGIEVILDVVYNHTAEADERGPTFCFRGLDNPTYYILEADRRKYANFSGTGNTLNAGHSVVRRLIIDSLRYWVSEMHVDGFRFDLASILARDTDGRPLPSPPLLWDIETDPVLGGTKLIAEAWDAKGLYQVGNFFGDHWREWNGRFRDDVRAFVRGDCGYAERMGKRFLASPDIYGHLKRPFYRTINFVTCHDGFTLNDLVSYNQKHNLENGEANRDGQDENTSWNCGVEGPTEDSAIEAVRARQIKNFLTINMLSLGVPMLLMGDEVRRTQFGNNNAYCQDNESSWLDWTLRHRHPGIFRFTRLLLSLRRAYRFDQREHLPLERLLEEAEITWHGVKSHCPDWSYGSHSVAFTAKGSRYSYFLVFNAYWQALNFEMPAVSPAHGPWCRVIDTAQPSPMDIVELSRLRPLGKEAYQVEAHSVVVFFSLLLRREGGQQN